MSTYLDSDTDALELDADAPRPVKYRELGVVASDDALDIGIHPISLRSKITPADTFSDRPDATLANPCTAPLPSSHFPCGSAILPRKRGRSRMLISVDDTCPDSLTKKFPILHAHP